jgi:hypothetical protein
MPSNQSINQSIHPEAVLLNDSIQIRSHTTGHARRLSASAASGRARRASSLSGSIVGEAMLSATAAQHRMRGRTASARICCICLDPVQNDEPTTGLFDCTFRLHTHTV